MISNRNTPILLILITAFTLIQTAKTTSTSFTVQGNEEITKLLQLKVEDHVLIHFSVVGGENTIHFILTYPNGTEKDFGETGYSITHLYAI